jgi:hypothetical protein
VRVLYATLLVLSPSGLQLWTVGGSKIVSVAVTIPIPVKG